MKKSLYSAFFLLLVFGCKQAADSPTAGGLTTTDGSYLSIGAGASDGGSAGGGSSAIKNPPPAKAGVITAGEWNDLEKWAFWANLMQTNKEYGDQRAHWQFYPNNLYTCTIQDAAGMPYSDVLITVRDQDNRTVWEGHTSLDGRISVTPEFFTNRTNPTYTLSATIRQRKVDLGTLRDGITFTVPTGTDGLLANSLRSNLVDIQLVVDATGSMGDEMSYLKNEFDDVLSRVYQQIPEATVRLGSVFYRDHGDDYVTRTLTFTDQSSQLMSFIAQQSAGGGGDTPEAVDEALDKAINSQSWSSLARTRLLFLVLDAPPHYTPAILDHLRQLEQVAANKGIRIIPITASGIDKDTEFLMRLLAIGTQGTYVFITNDSGIGNTHLIPSVGDYQVEYLNELMLRLIVKYAKRT